MKYLLLGFLLIPALGTSQTLSFDRDTDTVSISGIVTLWDDCTFEAWFKPSSLSSAGRIWSDWEDAATDKWLGVAPGEIDGYVWPASPTVPFSGSATISLNQWHHLAYVKQANTERIYMDGVLLNARSCGMNINNGVNSTMRLGAIFRDAILRKGPVGELDSLRISKIARYTQATYSLPPRDLANDANTEILYNFNEPVGSSSIQDLTGHGHSGTLGVGHEGATAPVLKGTPIFATVINTLQGNILGGSLAEVHEADGSYVFMQPTLNGSRSGANVEFVVNGVSPWPQPGGLNIRLNLAVALPNFSVTTELLNRNTNNWEVMDQRVMPLNDTAITIPVSSNLGAYFAAGTGAISMRIRVSPTANPLTPAWTVRFDQVRWQVSPPFP